MMHQVAARSSRAESEAASQSEGRPKPYPERTPAEGCTRSRWLVLHRRTHTASMGDSVGPRFEEAAVSWMTVWDRLFPEDTFDPHDDAEASEMHRLRGLVMAQAAETERVLGMISKRLAPDKRVDVPSGVLLKVIRGVLNDQQVNEWSSQLAMIEAAIKRRNRVVHDTIEVGSSWMPYATGGGEWVPVITLLGDEMHDESDLRDDLANQQDATCEAVRILRALDQLDD